MDQLISSLYKPRHVVGDSKCPSIYRDNFLRMELGWTWVIPWTCELRSTSWSPTANDSRQHNAQLTCQNTIWLLVKKSTTKWALIPMWKAQPDSPYCKGHDIWGINKNVKVSTPKILVDLNYSEKSVTLTGQWSLTKISHNQLIWFHVISVASNINNIRKHNIYFGNLIIDESTLLDVYSSFRKFNCLFCKQKISERLCYFPFEALEVFFIFPILSKLFSKQIPISHLLKHTFGDKQHNKYQYFQHYF